ncbi:FMN-binding negative transcriptional regulator [Streptomyces sp. NPDC057638]|uniref:FMN-binding negative transcriptional regulator n=1 Tax=Streptomyces sp. NPDC057638 TaxID=3346190 RepID=UPI0036B86C4A
MNRPPTMNRYLTSAYYTEDRERLVLFLRHFPLAMVVPQDVRSGSPVFLPLVVEEAMTARSAEPVEVTLVGHLDNHNPALACLDNHKVRAVFLGPNAYISPTDYATRQFPTWNYAVAQAAGMSRVIRDEEEKRSHMIQAVEFFETANGSDYRLDPDTPEFSSQLRNISFFRITVDVLGGTFKFAQEKSWEDRTRALDALMEKSRRHQQRTVRVLADMEGTA